jgi:glutathione-regulated potassium-efflux system ancillary protein KefG
MAKKILILFAHPRFEDSFVNQELIKAVSHLRSVHIRDLYELYPDFNIDVRQEQRILLEHDIIVWHHPFYWYSCPPILKQWIDLVLEYGWAYGKNGDKLKGKYIFNTISTGGSYEMYQTSGRNRFPIRHLLAPFDQTAYLCQMKYLPPFVVHNALIRDKEVLETHAQNYKEIILALRDETIDVSKLLSKQYLNRD